MAFSSAAGYNNLPNGVFSPTLFSKKVQKAFRKKSVVEDITNSDYFGEIKDYGDTVKIIKEPEITVSEYQRGTQLTPQDLEDSDFTLIVDRSNSFIFRVDDIEKSQSHVNWMDMAADRAAYKMKDKYDEDVLGYLSGYEKVSGATVWTARTAPVGTRAVSTADADELLAGNKIARSEFVSGGSASDSLVVGVSGSFDATPLAVLNRMNRKLDVLNVPKDGRWIVLDPVFVEMLMDENSKLINSDYNPGADQLTNGKLAERTIRGFRVYESNNLPYLGTGPGTVDSNGSTANFGVIIAGHDSSVATAQQMTKTESYRDPYSFGDITRGMHLYGRKILRPEGLVRAIYNIN